MLIRISSPYRKAGLLYEKWRDHYGKNSDDVLVIRAPSKLLNPTLPQHVIDRAFEDDPVSAEPSGAVTSLGCSIVRWLRARLRRGV